PAAAERAARLAARRFTALATPGWTARAEAVRLEARQRAHPDRAIPAEEFERVARDLDRSGFRTEATALRLTARRDGAGRLPRIAASAPTPL
ncbi:hypothetical protein, partial [Microbacterium sp. K41]